MWEGLACRGQHHPGQASLSCVGKLVEQEPANSLPLGFCLSSCLDFLNDAL